MFLHLSVILFRGGVCLSACWDTQPLVQTPPGADTLRSRPPLGSRLPLGADTPRSRYPPADGYCCGWYASYRNVFLFTLCKRKGKSDVTSHGIIGSSGGSKISRKEEPTPKMVHQPIFCTIFAENYMKIKDFGPRSATRKFSVLFILCDSNNENNFIASAYAFW